MKKRIIIGMGFIVLVLVTFFTFKLFLKPSIKNYEILHDEKFGGVYAKISIDDFNKKGFKYGDSVDVVFSNGKKLLDIPYYNGYYVEMDNPLVVGYPGYEYVKVGINYGADIWKEYNLTTKDKVTIKLNESKKYIKTQQARDIHYSDEQGKQSDVEFGNFRNVVVGNIKPNILYRSASPDDNTHNRAGVVDKLIEREKVKYIVNLSDSDDDIKNHISKEDFNSPYFLSLYNDNKVIALSMNMIFKNKDFSNNLVKGLTAIANNEGPYLVHCVEGKDRTGYVIMIIEALMGASYDEMLNDYMETYKNYYGITLESDKERYDAIKETNIDVMLKFIAGIEEKAKSNFVLRLFKNDNNELEDIDYANKAEEYLLSIGMTKENINKLRNNLSK